MSDQAGDPEVLSPRKLSKAKQRSERKKNTPKKTEETKSSPNCPFDNGQNKS